MHNNAAAIDDIMRTNAMKYHSVPQEQYQFLYDALEVIFPVQNGDVKAAQNSVQIVNETQAAEKPCSTTSTNQQEAEKSAAGDVSAATEEDSNCPTDTVEV